MRKHLPVTQRAYEFPEGTTLLSTTDEQSYLSYANAAFVSVSGFERDELIGQPHNLVRHSDMPKEAFEDMWATLKSGQSWTALVKNRRKDGDHYWVRANATPIQGAGGISGYMSVRTKPGAAEVEQAEALYRDFREGRAKGRKFHKGLVVRSGLWAWTSALSFISSAARVQLGLLAFALQVLLGAWLLGLSGATLAALGGVLALAGLSSWWWLHRQICRPLRRLQTLALQVAAGQIDKDTAFQRVDEIGMIQRSLTQAGLNLRSLLDDVTEQSRSLESSSQEISEGNLDLSSRTEQQAASLEETAASMEQINSTAKHNAGNAGEANGLAQKASDVARAGGDVVRDMVETMRQIDQASRQIVDIIGVIDSIAFQTNILALNAAVEAARAGEQGRGFAVVASEVRALAGRSADAAKQIKQLIATSVERVEKGSSLADHAGTTMRDIVVSIQRVSDIMGEIANASREQMSGILQVGEAIGNLDQSTQQNAALVEQSAASAMSLRHQAHQLVDAVCAFREKQSAAGSQPAQGRKALHQSGTARPLRTAAA